MIEFGNPLPYDIRICGSSNQGFIVTVGCATCVYTNKTDLLEAIGDYLDDPEKVEKAYNDSRKNCCEPMPDNGCDSLSRGHTHSMDDRPDRRNTLASHMEAMEPCCQEDHGPDEGCCSR